MGCDEALSRLSKKSLKNMTLTYDKKSKKAKEIIEKKVSYYKELSKDFLKRKNVDVVIGKDPSFRIFTQSLAKIEPDVLQLIAKLD